MSTEANKTLVRHTFEEFNKRNLNALDDFYAVDTIAHFPGAPQPLGVEAMKQMNAMYLRAFPDAHYHEEDLIAEGDKVVARWRITMTHTGEFQGIPPTGKQVQLTSIDIYRVSDGKIAEQWTEMDMVGMMQQLGVMPPQG